MPEEQKWEPDLPKQYLPTSEDTLNPEFSGWTDRSARVGVLATKVGMIGQWDEWGVRHDCTVVRLDNVQITDIKPQRTKGGLIPMQIGSGQKNWNRVPKTRRIQFEKADVNYKATIADFRVSPNALLPLGTEITVRHFLPGQFVDVKGTTIGKGFQGTIKRHGFARQAKSHGTSKAERKPGSIGQAGAGRVFPGTKMAGRMGGKSKTILGLKVFKIDPKRNIMYLKGHVPGKPGMTLKIRDAQYKKMPSPPPYPTFIPDPYEEDPETLIAPVKQVDPFVENLAPADIPTK